MQRELCASGVPGDGQGVWKSAFEDARAHSKTSGAGSRLALCANARQQPEHGITRAAKRVCQGVSRLRGI